VKIFDDTCGDVNKVSRLAGTLAVHLTVDAEDGSDVEPTGRRIGLRVIMMGEEVSTTDRGW
jgi:hypothetical protein